MQPPTLWPDEALGKGGWIWVSDLDWDYSVGDVRPTRDAAPTGTPIKIAGQQFRKGIGVQGYSVVECSLPEESAVLVLIVGLQQTREQGSGGLEFAVSLDGDGVWSSGPITDPRLAVEQRIVVKGGQRLRLATKRVGDASLAGAWADVRVFLPAGPASPENGAGQGTAPALVQPLAATEKETSERLAKLLGANADAERSVAVYDQEGEEVVLANNEVGVFLGLGANNAGRLTLFDRLGNRLVLAGGAPAVSVSGRKRALLPYAAADEKASPMVQRLSDPTWGGGARVVVAFSFRERPEKVEVELFLPDAAPYLIYRLRVTDLSQPSRMELPGFEFLTHETTRALPTQELRGRDEFLYWAGGAGQATPADDGRVETRALEAGSPFLVRDSESGAGVALGVLDWVARPVLVKTGRVQGDTGLALGISACDPGREYDAGGAAESPRLFLGCVRNKELSRALASFRGACEAVRPSAAASSVPRQQWASGPLLGSQVNEATLRAQMDSIFSSLSDLGSWQIVLDPGWYLCSGQAGSGWLANDASRFPRGISAVVDYAHQRGIQVVASLPLPLMLGPDSPDPRTWLKVSDLATDHRDWLIPSDGGAYTCDAFNSDFAYYLEHTVVWTLLRVLHLDGIRLVQTEGVDAQPAPGSQLRTRGSAEQTDEIHRLIAEGVGAYGAGAYLESDSDAPSLLRGYAVAFRLRDTEDTFSSDGSAAGLVQQIYQASALRAMLGLRPHLGTITGDPNASALNQWRLGAAVALGAPVALSFDLTKMSRRTLNEYRALLTAHRPFEGTVIYPEGTLSPSVFAHSVDDSIFVGLLNPTSALQTKRIDVHTLLPGVAFRQACFYDVFQDRFALSGETIEVEMQPQSFRLLAVRVQPGLLWTSSSVNAIHADKGMVMWLTGPASADGLTYIYAPGLAYLAWDGQSVTPGAALPGGGQAAYEPRTGVLALRYSHNVRHRVNLGMAGYWE